MSQSVRGKSYRNILFGLVAILLGGMISLLGCNTTSMSPPPSTQIPPAVPQRADLLGKVELAEILDDEDFAELYEVMAAPTPLI